MEESHYLILRFIINYSNQDNVAMAKEETRRSLEQNREPRDRPTTNMPIVF